MAENFDSIPLPPVWHLVTFRAGDNPHRVLLSLGDAWKVTAGAEPNVNRGTCGRDDFEAIRPDRDRPGVIEFWFRKTPFTPAGDPLVGVEPDHAIRGVRLLELQPVELGVPAKDERVLPIHYTLFFADSRWGLAGGRGGMLATGLVNPDPTHPDYTDKTPILPNSKLVDMCLRRSGLTYAAVPTGLDQCEPIRNLEWFGVPVKPELVKLLDHCDAVLCPRSDGSVAVEMRGSGDSPEGKVPRRPHDLLDAAFDDSELDVRPRRAYVCSAPTPVLVTGTLTGPSPDTFYWVAQDDDEEFKPLEKLVLLGFDYTDPVEAFRRDFAKIPEPWRPVYRRDFYRCLQVNPAKYDPRVRHVLRRVMSAEAGGPPLSVKFQVRRALQLPDGNWQNSKEAVNVSPVELHARRNIMYFADRIGLMQGNETVTDFEGFFEPVPANSMSVRFTSEAAIAEEVSDTGAPQPEYFVAGFERGDDNLVNELSDTQAEQAMKAGDPDAIFVNAPDLQLVRDLDAGKDNAAELKRRAKAMALNLIGYRLRRFRHIEVIGYYAVEISGRVAEIEFSQTDLKTRIKIDRWRSPLSPTNGARGKKGYDTPGKRPAASDRATELGSQGAVQPAVPLSSQSPRPTSPPTWFVGRVSAAVRIETYWRWTYTIVEQHKPEAGSLGAWADKPGGRTVTAYNQIEANNDTAGLLGNGVNTINLAGTGLEPKPAPVGTRLFVFPQTVTPEAGASSAEWWFQYENAIDGSCTP